MRKRHNLMIPKRLLNKILYLLLIVFIAFVFTSFTKGATVDLKPYNLPLYLKEIFKYLEPLSPPYAPEGSYGYTLTPFFLLEQSTPWQPLLTTLLSGESPTTIATFTGENTYNYSGYSLSSAGDVNGDGHGDIIIGAWGVP